MYTNDKDICQIVLMQRTMVFLRFPGDVHIVFQKFYSFQANKNIHLWFSLGRKLCPYKKKECIGEHEWIYGRIHG